MCGNKSKSRTKKKSGNTSRFCVSSLRRGHANLLCIVPILTDDPEGFRKIRTERWPFI